MDVNCGLSQSYILELLFTVWFVRQNSEPIFLPPKRTSDSMTWHLARTLERVNDKLLSHRKFTHWDECVHFPLMLDEWGISHSCWRWMTVLLRQKHNSISKEVLIWEDQRWSITSSFHRGGNWSPEQTNQTWLVSLTDINRRGNAQENPQEKAQLLNLSPMWQFPIDMWLMIPFQFKCSLNRIQWITFISLATLNPVYFTRSHNFLQL